MSSDGLNERSMDGSSIVFATLCADLYIGGQRLRRTHAHTEDRVQERGMLVVIVGKQPISYRLARQVFSCGLRTRATER